MQVSADQNMQASSQYAAPVAKRAARRFNVDRFYAFLMILPSIILLAIFVYGFIGQTFYWSLTDWAGLEKNPVRNYIGFANYERLFSDITGMRFRQELVNTFFFTSFFLIGCLVLGFLLAVLLDQNIKGEGVFRTIFLFPMALSFAVTGTIWRWLLDPGGGINVLPKVFGGKAWTFRWINNRSQFEFNWHEVPPLTLLLIIAVILYVFFQHIRRRKYLAAIYMGIPMLFLFLWIWSDWATWDDLNGKKQPLPVGITIVQPAVAMQATEGGSPAVYMVVLQSPPDSAVTVNITADPQVTVEPATLSFKQTNWNIPQPVTITAVVDNEAQGDRSSTLTFDVVSADKKYNDVANQEVAVSIVDNESAQPAAAAPVQAIPGITIKSLTAATEEGGRTGNYTVVLNSAPAADVTIAVNSSTEVVADPAQVVFTPENWQTAQRITVSAVDDKLVSGDRTVLLSHTTTSDDPNYNNIFVPPAGVVIAENDKHVMHGVFNWQNVPKYVVLTVIAGFVLYTVNLLWNGKRRAALLVGIPAALVFVWYILGGVDHFPNVAAPENYGFNVALTGVILAAMWQMSGYTMAMYLAGIRGIPEELREAARVDGCTEIQVYTRIVLPMLRPVTLSAAIVLGHISLKIFDLIFALVGIDHWPVSVPGVQVYYTMFRSNNFAIGSTIAVVLLVMVASVIIPYLVTSLRAEQEV